MEALHSHCSQRVTTQSETRDSIGTRWAAMYYDVDCVNFGHGLKARQNLCLSDEPLQLAFDNNVDKLLHYGQPGMDDTRRT